MADKSGADKSVTIISLPQMVDLALNSPEVGIVNFTVLHSLLHVIVSQLDLKECNVEFRGSDSVRLQNYIDSAKPGPLITLTEYTVGPDGKERKKKEKRRKKGKDEEKGKKDEGQKEIVIVTKNEDRESASSDSFQTIVVVDPLSKEQIAAEKPCMSIAMTKEQWIKLQKDIRDLQTRVKELSDMPGNMGLVDAIKKRGSSNTPILDMFQILTLVKRLDAVEEVMGKMTSMMEDIAETVPRPQYPQAQPEEYPQTNTPPQKQLDSSPPQKQPEPSPTQKQPEPSPTQKQTESSPPPQVQPLRQDSIGERSARSSITEKEVRNDLIAKSKELRRSLEQTMGGNNQVQEVIENLRKLEERVAVLESNMESVSINGPPKMQRRPSPPLKAPKGKSPPIRGVDEDKSPKEKPPPLQVIDEDKDRDTASKHPPISSIELEDHSEAIVALQQAVIDLREEIQNNGPAVLALKEVEKIKTSLLSAAAGAGSKNMPPDVKLGQIDLKIAELREQVQTMDTVYNQTFSNNSSRMDKFDDEIASLWEKIREGLGEGGNATATSAALTDLYDKLLMFQEDMAKLNDTANRLLLDRQARQDNLDLLVEQIELLKTVKADREDLEDALADKADACQINRKVSHEQFDAAYTEMSQSLEATLAKLRQQEQIWETSLDAVQKDMSNKLDKAELTPLKDFINAKLKVIQEKVKKVSSLKREYEAAGTKSKILRDVNCISCDADVVMKKQTDVTLLPRPYAMPPPKGPAPYLAYELDELRKQRKELSNGRNLNLLENAFHSMKHKPTDKDHLCNRYCGGSHTVTTPQQRVLRVGHFMEQWGPEITPVNEVLIKGTDGHLYKGRGEVNIKPETVIGQAPRANLPGSIMKVTELSTTDKPEAVKSEEPLKAVDEKKSSFIAPLE